MEETVDLGAYCHGTNRRPWWNATAEMAEAKNRQARITKRREWSRPPHN